MSKLRKWIVIVAGAVLAIAIITLRVRHREPSYQGLPLREWISVYANEDPDASATILTGHEGANAIRHVGTNALPFLLEWLRYEPKQSSLMSATRTSLLKLPRGLTPDEVRHWALNDEAEMRAGHAAFALGLFPGEAPSLIPQLEQIIDDPASPLASRRAVLALGYVGMDALPALSTRLANTNAPNRREVAFVIGFVPAIRTNETAVVPLLVRALEDHDPRVSRAAADSLVRLALIVDCPQPLVVVPALTNCLRPSTPLGLKISATKALSVYGDKARAAIPHLLSLTTDQDFALRSAATNALLKIAPETLPNSPAK